MARMTAPPSGVRIRMYRIGHGDCFLLAFPRQGRSTRPVYVLIDCGYKPGSQIKYEKTPRKNGKKVTATDVVRDIGQATDKKLDLVIVTA